MTRQQKFVPTEEQQRAREVFAAGRDLALGAGAGTGKTATLEFMAASTSRAGLYLAFNRAIADDAASRFPDHVECRTAHSVALQATGTEHRRRLNISARIPNKETARLLGITRDIAVDSSRITPAHQARLVMGMIRRFCYRTETEVMARHMEPVNGLAPVAADYVARVLLRYAVRAWEDICSPAGKLRFEHDHYLKMWALTRPVLAADFVLLDEAQDTNPVLEEIFLNQDAQRVCVGDPAQQIYAWRSARDVMTGFPGEHLELTRSFRFGARIAEVANRWLRHAESGMRLTGSGPAASQVGVAAKADAVLCRGNADAIKEIMAFLDAGLRVALTGGGVALNNIAEAAQELKAGHRTSHPELFLFSSWGEVQEYVENDDAAQDLRSFVRLVDAHGPETIIEAVRRLSAEESAQVTVSTAHRAKGREWDSVRVGPGFGPPPVDDDGRQRPLHPAEARLIYVAVTRARRMLDPEGIAWADDYEKAVAPPAADGTVGGLPMIDLPLTRQLSYPASPISRFLDDHLPGHHHVARDYLTRIRGLRHPIQPMDVRKPAWSALGHTIDFRLRLSLGCPLGNAVSTGVALIGGDMALRGAPPVSARAALHRAGRELLAAVDTWIHDPSRVPSEEDITRLCFVAAFYESIYRTGEMRRGSMLAAATPTTTLRELVRAVPVYAVGDISQQMRLAEPAFREFRALPRRAVTCGPEFTGSADIGGADADFILGGLLLDCKSTTRPGELGRDEIYQLTGYLLLDYQDEFSISRVGLYLSRQGATITWDVGEFLRLLGATVPLPELRDKLRRHLTVGRARSRSMNPYQIAAAYLGHRPD
jgi:hypothetical protein